MSEWQIAEIATACFGLGFFLGCLICAACRHKPEPEDTWQERFQNGMDEGEDANDEGDAIETNPHARSTPEYWGWKHGCEKRGEEPGARNTP